MFYIVVYIVVYHLCVCVLQRCLKLLYMATPMSYHNYNCDKSYHNYNCDNAL